MCHSHLPIKCGSDLQQKNKSFQSAIWPFSVRGWPHPTAPATAGFPQQNPKGREETLRHQAHRGGDVADPGGTFLPRTAATKAVVTWRKNMGKWDEIILVASIWHTVHANCDCLNNYYEYNEYNALTCFESHFCPPNHARCPASSPAQQDWNNQAWVGSVSLGQVWFQKQLFSVQFQHDLWDIVAGVRIERFLKQHKHHDQTSRFFCTANGFFMVTFSHNHSMF